MILVLGETRIPFEVGDFSNRDGMDIERATGMTWQEFIEAAVVTSAAKTALVWIVRRRNGEPDLQYDDVTFALSEFDVEPDPKTPAELEAEEAAAANPPRGGAARPARGPGRAASPRPKSSTGSPPAKS